MPGGLYDRFPIPVFVSEIGSYGEVRHTRAPHLENVDVADIPPDFDFVQLFHNSVHLMVYTAKLSVLTGFLSTCEETSRFLSVSFSKAMKSLFIYPLPN